EVQTSHVSRDPPRERNRQRELGIGCRRNGGVPHDARAVRRPRRKPRTEHPDFVAAGLEPATERLDRDRDAPGERQIVVCEERDPPRPAQALLNFSKSSGLMFCSHSLSRSGSSAFTGSAPPSFATSRVFALRTTSSSTKIGAATRSASAIASDGRESTVYSCSPIWRYRTAKKVLSRRSVTTTFTTRASIASRMFLIRSCVIGRGVAIFSSSSAIALASKIPTQIGSERLSSSSRR